MMGEEKREGRASRPPSERFDDDPAPAGPCPPGGTQKRPGTLARSL